MKTIEEAAKDYADRYFEERLGNCGAKNGFKAGIEYALQWISVDDELPHYGVLVLVKNKVKGICVEGFYGKFNYNITHWRAIELR
jgi:hypothetical protein